MAAGGSAKIFVPNEGKISGNARLPLTARPTQEPNRA
jgi:hypothetical protein